MVRVVGWALVGFFGGGPVAVLVLAVVLGIWAGR